MKQLTVKKGAAVSSIVQTPIETKEICCNAIPLTLGMSATLPKMIRPTPEVMAMQVTKVPPFCSGNKSLTY